MRKIALLGVGAGEFIRWSSGPYADISMIGRWPAQLAAADGWRAPLPRQWQRHRASRPGHQRRQAVGQVDVILMLVKSYQTEHAARQAGQLLSPHGVVVTLQNGLGNLDRIAAVVGADRATLGVTAQGAMLMAPGVVQDTGAGPIYVALPVHAAPLMATGLQSLVDLLRQADFTVHVVTEADSLLWGKLAVNTGLNPLTALLRVPNGFVAEHETARAVLWRRPETAAVAQARDCLPYAHAGQYALEVARAHRRTIPPCSRMSSAVRRRKLEDLWGGRESREGPWRGDAGERVITSSCQDGGTRRTGHHRCLGAQLADADTLHLFHALLTQASTAQPGVITSTSVASASGHGRGDAPSRPLAFG